MKFSSEVLKEGPAAAIWGKTERLLLSVICVWMLPANASSPSFSGALHSS